MKKSQKYAGLVIAVILILLAAFVAWLKLGSLNPTKAKVLGALHVPIAVVEGKTITMNEFDQQYTLIKKISQDSGASDDKAVKQDVFNAMIDERKLQKLSDTHNVSVSDKELNEEYDIVAAQTNSQDGKKLSDFLSTYGLSENMFKQSLLRPQILNAKLSTWFNNQRDLNGESYKTADELVQKIQNGENMGELAKTYSDDPASKDMDGDMGFLSVSDLLTELRESVDSLNPGQVRLVVSRFGLHIIKLEERGKEGTPEALKVHLRQIYIKPGNFEQWYDDQIKGYKVRTFFNPVA